MSDPVTVLAVVATIGVGGQVVARHTRVPAIVLLLGAGMVLGPATSVLDPDAVYGDLLFPVASTAVALVLFEGGLSLRVRDLEDERMVLARLLSAGVAVTWVVGAGAAALTGLPAGVAALFGAIMVVTGPTVIIPLLRDARLRPRVSRVLRWEGILIDPVGAVLAVVTFEVLVEGGHGPGDAAIAAAATVGAGVTVAVVAAIVLVAGMRTGILHSPLDTAGVVTSALAAFAGGNLLFDEAGLVAATALGVVLANQRAVDIRAVVRFHESLGVVLVGVVFVLLAARVNAETLADELPAGLVVLVALVVVARPAAVWASTIGSGLTRRERSYLATMAPRGIVAAAISALFGLRLEEVGTPGGGRLAALTFLVMTGTVVVYGIAARPLARRLRVAAPQACGVVIVGGDRWALRLGTALVDAGVPVLVLTADDGERKVAADAGLLVHAGRLDVESLRHSLEAIGARLAIVGSRRDELNELAVELLSEPLGRPYVHGVTGTSVADGRAPIFAAPLSVDELDDLVRCNHDFEVRRADGVRRSGVDVVFVSPEGLPQVIEPDADRASTGTVIVLAPRP